MPLPRVRIEDGVVGGVFFLLGRGRRGGGGDNVGAVGLDQLQLSLGA